MQLTFNIKPISLNYCFITNFKTKRRSVSKQYAEFKRLFKAEALRNRHTISSINQLLSSNDLALSMDYKFYSPKVMKKDGGISKTGGDVSNFIKPIEDCIFEYLRCDDSQVMSVSATKIHAEAFKIDVSISFIPLTDLPV